MDLTKLAIGAGDTVARPVEDRASGACVGLVLVGRFKLLEEIGHGGMGAVWSARDTVMQGEPLLAIKLLGDDFRKNADAVTALERECRRVRMLAHENVVRVFEFYSGEDHVFITMELLQGETFNQVIERNPNGMPFEAAWPLLRQAGSALAYSHRQTPPFIHYDFKPRNMFLTQQTRVKVLDFGVARAIRSKEDLESQSRLYETAMPGFLTLSYASCEMIEGLEPDPRDDVYAFACVTYELLSGSHPFVGIPADNARAAGLKPKPIVGLNDIRNRALCEGLAFERSARTASIEQFVAAFEPPPADVPAKTTRIVLGAAAFAAVAVAVIGFGLRPASVPETRAPAVPMVSGSKASGFYALLGIDAPPVSVTQSYPRAEVADRARTSSRHVKLGSTPDQIQAAFDLCRHYAKDCSVDMYSDEQPRVAVLSAFQLDPLPVTVHDFNEFVVATGYRTQAEEAGLAYATSGETLKAVRGGNWRNAVAAAAAPDDSAVVAVGFRDAQRYCNWRQQRLPTEDEWEYVARGPELRVFPWGDDVTPAVMNGRSRPPVKEGRPGGIGDLYRGLSGNVWQWVDTRVGKDVVLKGGSWLETNPANKRAAARRTDIPDRADSDSGFRCARSVPEWPDAQYWIDRYL